MAEQRTLLERIPQVRDLQSAWLLLLHCATARAKYLLRVVEPQAVAEYARLHDNGTWNCLCHILHISPEQGADIRSAANLPLVFGELGVRSASRVCVAAYWASWADCLTMIQARHPEVANMFLEKLEGWPDTPFLGMAPRERALVRSQAGSGAGLALTVAPTSHLTRIPPHLLRVVLLLRLRLPLPLSLHSCRCGRHIDQFGRHRAACARAGVLRHREGSRYL